MGSFNWSGFGESALNTAVSGLFGQVFGAANAARDYHYQSKLMGQQDQYNRGLMSYQSDLQRLQADYENQLSRTNLQDSPRIQKQGLLDAGLSPVLASGSPQVASTPSVGSPSVTESIPGFSSSPGSIPDMNYNMLLTEQRRGVNLDNKLKEVELKYADPSKRAELDRMLEDLRQLKESFPARLDQMKAAVDQTKASTGLSNRQAEHLQKSMDKLVEETETIRINNKYLDRHNDMEIRDLEQRVAINLQKARYEKVVADLADVGIIVGADWFTQLAAVVHQGSAPEIMNELVKFVDDVFSNLGSSFAGLSGAVIDGITKSVHDAAAKLRPRIPNPFKK